MCAGWGASRLLVGCILLTTAITAALITALTSFWVQALGQAADGQLARSGAMSIVISGQVNARIAAAGGRAVRATMHIVFGNIPYQLDAARWSDPLGFTTPGQGGATAPAAPENGRTIRLAEAAALGQIRAHAVLVTGAWPGPPGVIDRPPIAGARLPPVCSMYQLGAGRLHQRGRRTAGE